MMRIFDTILVVDWSARSTPSPPESADAAWIGPVRDGAAERARYFRTRAEAMHWITETLVAERAAGRRVLAGFDFPFGYPQGFAEVLTGKAAALAVWSHLATHVTDGPGNVNNRFAAAAAINAGLPGIGPFWGRPARLNLPDLPAKASLRRDHGFAERRLIEARVRRAKTCWQLAGAGSVGGQVLVGLPALERLRHDPRLVRAIAVWPLEGGLRLPEAPIVLAELYPSLLAGAVDAARERHPVKDAVQVLVAASALAGLDAAGGLAALFSPDLPREEAAIVEREEAWILGAGFEAELRAAAPPPLCDDCFALPPGVDWVPVEKALAHLRDNLAPVTEPETVPLAQAGGRILAAPFTARRAHPPYANSAVDGYGLAFASLGLPPHRLPLIAGRAAAGDPFGGEVPAGSAVRILTGAMLPRGVDTVVLEEDVSVTPDAISFAKGLKRGANTRPEGEDVAAGAEIAAPGQRLRPLDLALGAAVGIAEMRVFRQLRVGVLSTGDEIRPPGSAIAAHQIFDANSPMLLDMLHRWGVAPVDLGHAPDTEAAVGAALDAGAAGTDAILTTGGASAGDEDHVSRLLRAHGNLAVWRIAVKPGRPLALGHWKGVPVFGLPGNPVAAFVCALIFVYPALGRLAGAPWRQPQGLLLPAAFEKAKKAGRREYLRARRNAEGAVEVFPSEGSGRISSLVWARGLVELEDGPRTIRPGDPVLYIPFNEFGI